MIYQAGGYVWRSYLCSSPRFPEKGIKISDKGNFLHVCLFDGISVNANQSGTRGAEAQRAMQRETNRQTNALFKPLELLFLVHQQIYG